jgi:hypothetical protein
MNTGLRGKFDIIDALSISTLGTPFPSEFAFGLLLQAVFTRPPQARSLPHFCDSQYPLEPWYYRYRGAADACAQQQQHYAQEDPLYLRLD